MAKPLSFETITDAEKGAELIHKYIRRQRVEFPDDLADLISEIAAELLCSVDACHRADFLLREKNEKKEAGIAMNEVMTAITTFKNQLGFLVSQADYCTNGVNGVRKADAKYAHKPNNKLPLLPANMIAQGLNGLKADFRGWSIERRTDGWVLVVETNPVQIADPRYDVVVNFGVFNIELILSQLARGVGKPYQIVALEPNICEGHSHPHLRAKSLCEGNGEAMIRKALQVGDIQSFLIIISQILATYNPGSPYLRLEYWSKKLPRGPNPRPHASFGVDESGESVCTICDGETSDPYNCSLCNNIVCESCSNYCDDMDRTICNRCKNRLLEDRIGCSGCSHYGNPQCAVDVRRECADCHDTFLSANIVRCAARNINMCRNCFNRRTSENRPCCASWESTPTCPMLPLISNTAGGFAGTAVAAPPIAGADPEAVPRRRDGGFIDTAPDDGIGGFAPTAAGGGGGGATGLTGITGTTDPNG